ncbi:hypothetical protein SAMN05192558_104116 [Actinokineospora alba]|uniref:Transposase DDE domain-containing protein n=1 Tax=Actinokineospora alba TaxID=504798 RepID=A0A1H0LEW4_9PSEU|nr:hypothetical protein C8E96_2835 [Actinokineospora alba]SDJ01295.1 hypothetical protein SAMN05421871_109181 [Actinokineospora alba]SDO66540.1 hypothetical protein SAMN05192558_104116 [Actinokineospora alba]
MLSIKFHLVYDSTRLPHASTQILVVYRLTDSGRERRTFPAGSKHHLITDATGIPPAVTLTGGNRNDVTQLIPLTLVALLVVFPVPYDSSRDHASAQATEPGGTCEASSPSCHDSDGGRPNSRIHSCHR